MDAFQELTPVIYRSNGINYMRFRCEANTMPFSAHWHNRIELLHIVSGSLEVYLNDVHATAQPGQTVIILPNTIHCAFTGSAGAEYHVIAFSPERFCNDTMASGKYIQPLFQQKAAFCPVTCHPKVSAAMDELISLLAAGEEYHPLCTVGKLYEVIGLFYQHCAVDASQVRKPDERFGAVLAYVNSHYTEDISAKNLSEKFGYDEAYFCRRFKEATGTNAAKYIRYLRLENAQHLLRTSRESIRNIALKCGFSDICYFSSCFKRQFGISPTEFRMAGES